MATSQPIRVAVVEDVREERERLVSLLRGWSELECVAACGSAEEALQALPSSAPQVILMDIQLPGLSGIDCVRRIRELIPEVEVMMLTVLEDHERIFASLAAGATGYLLKKSTAAKLREAINELHGGSSPMTGQIARLVVSAFRKEAATRSELGKLSPTEASVLRQLARGLLYKEIADQHNLSLSTVRTHIHHIYKKLHVHNRTEAVNKALGRRLSA